MITLIQHAECYAPTALGTQQLLVAGSRIAAIAPEINLHGDAVQLLDARGCVLVPGFVDSLAHIIGGGGEGGFSTRTRELDPADAMRRIDDVLALAELLLRQIQLLGGHAIHLAISLQSPGLVAVPAGGGRLQQNPPRGGCRTEPLISLL